MFSLRFFFLFFFFFAFVGFVNCDDNLEANRAGDFQGILVKYYNGQTIDDYVNVRLGEITKLLQFPTFNPDNPTVIYVHSHDENPKSESVQTIISAYLRNLSNVNLLVLDWSNMSYGVYALVVAPKAKSIGEKVADELKNLIKNGLQNSSVHLIGFSLGGQIAGFIGKRLQYYQITVDRITALDPAFILFYPGLLWGHLTENDAKFVDVIHTDPGHYGAPEKTGTVDFWVNPGERQAGCPNGWFILPGSVDDLCSHWRSWKYWAESLDNPYAFPALKAENHGDYQKKLQIGITQPVAYMGLHAVGADKGNYYLRTNNASPFGTGKL